jgi:hypothetical protein
MQLAMGMLGWSQTEKVALVPLNANRFLTMMSITAVGWLLLDAGIKSHGKAGEFFEGKVASAKWYGRNVVPSVEGLAKMAQLEDSTPVEISDGAFGTI